MPIQTDLSVSPYFDDYTDTKDFYKILFRPGVAVQARELNQLQTILQRQVERFGDNVFRRGTIIDGCHMSFHSIFPYVKIKDNSTDGTPINVSQFEGLYIKNSANLQALVVKSIPGFESRNPDLNTLYVRYLNSGTSHTDTAYSADQVLTIFDNNNAVFKINVNNGSSGFNNTDYIAVVSSLGIQNSTGGTTFASGFVAGDTINNGLGANSTIISVDNTTNTQIVILNIKPLASNLKLANTALWKFNVNDGILDINTGQAANVVSIIGSGATATPVTDSVGQIIYVAMTSAGGGYYVPPTIAVASLGANLSQITTANLTSQTYLTQITVANNITVPVGTGYGMSIDDGVIYQKGYFSRVGKQLIVVEKYSNTPDAKSVGFDTNEDIINSSIDTSLLDNASGSFNSSAPGANRLRLTPVLSVLNKTVADANSDFFTIAEFSEGLPYKQNRQTTYNIVGAEMARRTFEEAGNYVLDQFIMNTKSATTFANEPNQFVVTVDPGQAYISGYRVETLNNYNITVKKGIDTEISNNASISLTYGNYIRVNEVGGVFKFSIGDIINLYDAAKTYITSSAGAAITSTGNLLGTARIRSMVVESGTPGTSNCIYRLYIFDIEMNAGLNFKNVRSVYYNGTNKGVADIILATDPSSGTNIATVYDNNLSAMTFYSGADALKNANNVSYIYRTIDETRAANTLGIATKSLGTNETFPYTGILSNANKADMIYIPLANGQAAANIGGTLTSTSGSNVVTGVATTFLTDLVAGDYINIANTVSNIVVRIATIANNTQLTLANNSTLTIAANAAIYFPQFVPVSLDNRRAANVSANGSVLTVGLGTNLAAGINVALAYNVKAANVQPVTKSVNRDIFVRLTLANNAASNTGPWVLGISDIFRLKNVYLGSNNTFVSTDPGIIDVTNEFYIDHNQNENYYDTSYLYKKPKSTLAITTANMLLVQLDAYTTTTDGLKFLQSYPVDDTKTLSASLTSVNTLEIPEMYDVKGNYYDMRDQMDFRPVSYNTATVTTIPASASINPIEPSASVRFTNIDKKFPAPNSSLQCNLEYYLARNDGVIVNSQGSILVLNGIPGSDSTPDTPQNSLAINNLNIPPYPSLPMVMSANMVAISDTKIANEQFLNRRLTKYKISTPVTLDQRSKLQPRGYRMEDIGELERRIRDLEYYVSFTLAETVVKQRVIPSSVNASLDRFKFGFFVDTFSDYSYSDINNPDYYASIQDGMLSPRLDEINIEQKFNRNSNSTNEAIAGQIATFPYNEFALVSQLNSTDGPVITLNTPAITSTSGGTTTVVSPISNNVTNVVTTTQINQTIVNTITESKNSLVNASGYVWEETEYKLSSLPGPAAIYLLWTGVQNAIEVFYGSTPGFAVDALTPKYNALNVAAINSTDISYNYNNFGFDISFRDALEQHFYNHPKPAVENTGKLLWTHDPALGQYVKIRITKYMRDGNSTRNSEFSYNFVYPSDSTQTTVKTLSSPNVFVYNGNVVGVTPASFTVHTTFAGLSTGLGLFGISGLAAGSFIADAQAFSIVVSGLKPNTIHTFTFDNADNSSKCKQGGKNLGDPLISGSDGTLAFQYFYDAGITEASSDFTQQAKLVAAMTTGIKTFTIKSSDSASIATGTIEIKTYMQAAINNNTTPVANTTAVQTSINVSTILANFRLGNFHL